MTHPHTKTEVETEEPGPTTPAPGPAPLAPKPAAARRWARLPPPPPVTPLTWALLSIITVLALAVRLKDPLTHPIIGAEDPYLHMERAWNLVQGEGAVNYPKGYILLLAPFTLLGPDGFYTVGRFLPPFIGAGAVVATFFLCRRHLEAAGALTAGLVIALAPEHIVRTNLLFPTALDLLVLPILFLAVMNATSGDRRWIWTAAGLGAFLLSTHPWVVALAGVPIVLYLVIVLVQEHGVRRLVTTPAVGGVGAIVVGFLVLPRPTGLNFAAAFPKISRLVGDPSTINPLPRYVNFDHMLGWSVVALAAAGAVAACVRRTRFALLTLLWALTTLPLVLVDWFDVWYLPHRSMAYFAIAAALLAGLAVNEIMRLVSHATPRMRRGTTLGVMAILLLALLPAAASTPAWYRIYRQQDFDAWEDLEASETPYLVTSSWESRTGYRVATARPAVYNPEFFENSALRDYELQQHPDLVVLVDGRGGKDAPPVDFLSDWTVIGRWGGITAYTHT